MPNAVVVRPRKNGSPIVRPAKRVVGGSPYASPTRPRQKNKSGDSIDFAVIQFESSSESDDDTESGKKLHERNLMQRYGVAHHKHKAEQALLSYEMAETEPRSVANAILHRLRDVDGSLKLADLKGAFYAMTREEMEMLLPSKARVGALDESGLLDVSCDTFLHRMIPFFQYISERTALPTQLKHARPRHSSPTRQEKSPSVDDSEEKLPYTVYDESIDLYWDSEDDVGVPGALSGSDAGDVFTLPFSAWCRGLESLFAAVDTNNTAVVTWDTFLSYLMDASLLGRIGRREVEVKTYDFVNTVQVGYMQELVSIAHTGVPRDQFLIVTHNHVSLVANTPHFPLRHKISLPAETVSPQLIAEESFGAITAQIIETANCVMVSCTDSAVRFYALHRSGKSGQRQHQILAEIRLAVNQTATFYDPDRSVLFCGSRKGELSNFQLRYRPSTGLAVTPLATAAPHQDSISCIAPVSSENGVVTSSFDRLISIHDWKTLKTLKVFPGHSTAVTKVVHVPDFNVIVSTSFDLDPMVALVSLHSRPAFRMTDVRKPHLGAIVALEYVPHQSSAVTMDVKGLLKVWDLKTFSCAQSIAAGSTSLSKDGGMFAFETLLHTYVPPSADQPMGVTRLYAATRQRIYVFEYNYSQRLSSGKYTADDEPLLMVHYSPDHQTYLTASGSAVRVWDAQTCVVRDTFRNPSHAERGGISACHVHPNGRLYFVGTHDGSLFAHNVSTGGITYALTRIHPAAVSAIQFCTMPGVSATDFAVSLSVDQVIVASSTFSVSYQLDVERPRCVDYDEIIRTLAFGDLSGNITVYQAEHIAPMRTKSLTVLRFPKPMPREITACKILRSQSLMACADSEGDIALFGIRGHSVHLNTCLAVWKHCSDGGTPPPIICMNYFLRRAVLYCGDETGMISAYDLRPLVRFAQRRPTANNSSSHVGFPNVDQEGRHHLDYKYGGHRRVGVESDETCKVARLASLVKRQEVSPAILSVRPSILQQLQLPPSASPGETESLRPPEENEEYQEQVSVPEPQPAVAFTLDDSVAEYIDTSSSASTPRSELSTNGGTHDSSLPFGERKSATEGGPGRPPLHTGGSATFSLKTLGKKVSLVNRWHAHDQAVTSIAVRNDAVYAALLSSGIDQVAAGWSFSGGTYLGALDQYGRVTILLRSPTVADDVKDFLFQREEQIVAMKKEGRDRREDIIPGNPVEPQIPAAIKAHAISVPSSDSLSRQRSLIRVEIPEFAASASGSVAFQDESGDFLDEFEVLLEATDAKFRRRSQLRRSVFAVPEEKYHRKERKRGATQQTLDLLLQEERDIEEERRVIGLAAEMLRPHESKDMKAVDEAEAGLMRVALERSEGMSKFHSSGAEIGRASRFAEEHPPPVPELVPFPEGTFTKSQRKARRKSKYRSVPLAASRETAPLAGFAPLRSPGAETLLSSQTETALSLSAELSGSSKLLTPPSLGIETGSPKGLREFRMPTENTPDPILGVDVEALLPPTVEGDIARSQLRDAKTVENALQELWKPTPLSNTIVCRNDLAPASYSLQKTDGLFPVQTSSGDSPPSGYRSVVRMQPPPPGSPPRLTYIPSAKPRPRDVIPQCELLRPSSRSGPTCPSEGESRQQESSTALVTVPVLGVRRPQSSLAFGSSTSSAKDLQRSKAIDQYVMRRTTHLLDDLDVLPHVRKPGKLRFGAAGCHKKATGKGQRQR